MDQTGYVTNILRATTSIDAGRKGFPKDSFHIACIGHKTRIQNILRSPGIDPIEKSLLKQRFSNIVAAQNSYIEKQKKVS